MRRSPTAYILATALALALLPAPAAAADLRLAPAPAGPAAAPAAPAATWSGLYAGINGGYGWGSSRCNAAVALGAGVAAPCAGILAALGNPANFASPAPRGWFGGAGFGANWQLLGLVVGLETDAQLADLSQAQRVALGAGPSSLGLKVKTDAFGTVRGRLGYAMGAWLPYVTGGLAWAHHVVALDPAIAAPPVAASLRDDRFAVGWTAGAGLEWRMAQNWSLKAEYLFMDFGRDSYTLVGPALVTSSLGLRQNIVRLGLNGRWGP